MYKLLVVLAIVALTGCSGNVYQADINRAITVCGSSDKIQELHTDILTSWVICTNGVQKRIDNIIAR